MIDQQDPNHENLLEHATEVLRHTPVPQGPSEEVLSKIAAEVENVACQQQPSLALPKRIRAMNPLAKITATAASLIIVCGTLMWMLTAGGGASIALADVAKVLDKIHSATFTGTTTAEGEELVKIKAMYLEPSRSRMEFSSGMTMIFNESKMINLVPEKKMAIVFNLENAADNPIAPNWFEDVRLKLQAAVGSSEDDIEALGTRTIDGQDTVGFRLHIENEEMTVWADPETALPIRLEKTTGLAEPKYHTVMSDFRFNVSLDESLFSVEPPAGYTVQESSMDASKPREQDFVKMLRLYTANQDSGLFPPTLAMVEIMKGSMQAINEDIAKFGDWRDDAELREKVLKSDEYKKLIAVGVTMGRGIGFLQQELPPAADWHYAGKNVKLGTADRPIFWYRPAESETYRVIYADLSTQDVAAEKLKDFPESIGRE